MQIHVLEVASHRNGCTGEPFHAVRFEAAGNSLLGIVFEQEGRVAVIDPALAVESVAFGKNSWRGDWYERALRDAVKGWEELQWADFHARRGRFAPKRPALRLATVGGAHV